MFLVSLSSFQVCDKSRMSTLYDDDDAKQPEKNQTTNVGVHSLKKLENFGTKMATTHYMYGTWRAGRPSRWNCPSPPRSYISVLYS